MSIEERLERLERQNKWMRRIGLLCIAVTAAVLLLGQAKPTRVLAAERFEVRDKQGRLRAELAMFEDNTGSFPGLVFKRTDGKDNLVLLGGNTPAGAFSTRP